MFYGEFREKVVATSAPFPTSHATNPNRTRGLAGWHWSPTRRAVELGSGATGMSKLLDKNAPADAGAVRFDYR
jgi:hypothetical protein